MNDYTINYEPYNSESAIADYFESWFSDWGSNHKSDQDKCYKAFRLSGLLQKCVSTQTAMLFGGVARVVPASSSESFNKEAAQKLKHFFEHFYIKGNLDLLEFLSVCEHERMVRGEVFVRIIRRRNANVPFQLQIIPSSQVPFFNKKLENKNQVINGIEFKGLEVVAYYVKVSQGKTIRIPKSSMLHLLKREDANQVRGVSCLKSSIEVEAQLETYKEADITRKIKNAQFVGVIETPAPENMDANLESDDDENEESKPKRLKIENKDILTLPIGTRMELFNSSDSGDSYVEHINSEKKDICCAVGVPYHLVNDDFKNMNDRASREITNLYKRKLGQIKSLYIKTILQPLYQKFIQAYGLADIESRFDAKFYFEPYAYAHPVQDLKAKSLELELGIKSKIDLCEERGVDWQQIIQENKQYEIYEGKKNET